MTVCASSIPPATTPATPVTTALSPNLSIVPVTPVRSGHPRGDTTPSCQATAVDVDADAIVDMDVDASANPDSDDAEAFILPGVMGMSTDHWGSLRWPDDLIGDDMLYVNPHSTLDWDPTTEVQSHASSEALGAGSTDPSSGNSAGTSQNNPDESGPGLESDLVEDNSMGENSGGSDVFPTTIKNGFELSLEHLSRLSTRLSQLLLASCSLARTLDLSREPKDYDPAVEVQPAVETVFKSINSWLVHGSVSPNPNLDLGPMLETGTTDDLLHHVFSASNHLLDILRYLHVSIVCCAPNSSTAYPSPPASSNSSSSHVKTTSMCLGDANRLDRHSHTAIHHLVVACVNLLLNIYVAILAALQRSADVLSSSLLARNSVEPSDQMDAASRAHIQLVSVAQLCSYFIKRQNQTMDIISSSQRALHASSLQDCNPKQSVSPDATSRHLVESMGELKKEVEQRLKRLQESLCIFT